MVQGMWFRVQGIGYRRRSTRKARIRRNVLRPLTLSARHFTPCQYRTQQRASPARHFTPCQYRARHRASSARHFTLFEYKTSRSTRIDRAPYAKSAPCLAKHEPRLVAFGVEG
eukprot:3941701-Rhodomonas_salina.3